MESDFDKVRSPRFLCGYSLVHWDWNDSIKMYRILVSKFLILYTGVVSFNYKYSLLRDCGFFV